MDAVQVWPSCLGTLSVERYRIRLLLLLANVRTVLLRGGQAKDGVVPFFVGLPQAFNADD